MDDPSLSKALRGMNARSRGRQGEWLAAVWLMLHGWRIVGFRLDGPGAEIDILARKGDVLAVVEVKVRSTLDQALEAVRPSQRRRLRRAAAGLAVQRAAWRRLNVRLDLLALAPGRLPRHIPDAWPDEGA